MTPGRRSLRLLAVLLLGGAAAARRCLRLLAGVAPELAPRRRERGRGAVWRWSLGAIWAALVAVVAARSLAGEARSMVALAERGVSHDRADDRTSEDGLSGVQRRLVAALEERNRQISRARCARAARRRSPMTRRAVACAMVAGARQATGDPTWTLAVLRVHDGGDLRARRLRTAIPTRRARPLGEVHLLGVDLGADWMAAAGGAQARLGAVGRLRGRRRRRRRRAARDPAGPLGGATATRPRRSWTCSALLGQHAGNRDRARPALYPRADPGRRAEPDGRRPDRLPARHHARPPDAADQHPGARVGAAGLRRRRRGAPASTSTRSPSRRIGCDAWSASCSSSRGSRSGS